MFANPCLEEPSVHPFLLNSGFKGWYLFLVSQSRGCFHPVLMEEVVMGPKMIHEDTVIGSCQGKPSSQTSAPFWSVHVSIHPMPLKPGHATLVCICKKDEPVGSGIPDSFSQSTPSQEDKKRSSFLFLDPRQKWLGSTGMGISNS